MIDFKYFEWFERKVKIINYYITRYGIEHINFAFSFKALKKDANKKNFFNKVHEGFEQAQEEIIQALLIIDNELAELKKLNIDLRLKKQPVEIKELKKNILILKYHELVFRKLADSIAWQLLNLEKYRVRRLIINKLPTPIKNIDLENTNKSIKWLKVNYPNSFTLITDITTFIHIGDLLVFDSKNNQNFFIELKSGIVNEEITNMIEAFNPNNDFRNFKLFDAFFANDKNEKKYKQLKRVIKQDRRVANVISVFKNDKGIDNQSGEEIKIFNCNFKINYFSDRIQNLFLKSQLNISATMIIDKCLLVGLYNSQFFGNKAMEMWLMLKKIKPYPVLNYIQSFYDPTAFPPFLQAIDSNFIEELVLLKKHLFFALDFDKWLIKAKKNGFEFGWLTKKQTIKLLQGRKDSHKPFIFKDQALEFSYKKNKVLLEQGILARIFYDWITPTSALKILKSLINKAYKK